MDDGIHPSDGVHLGGDASGVNGATKVTHDHASRVWRKAVERRGSLARSRLQNDLIALVMSARAAARPKPSVLPAIQLFLNGDVRHRPWSLRAT